MFEMMLLLYECVWDIHSMAEVLFFFSLVSLFFFSCLSSIVGVLTACPTCSKFSLYTVTLFITKTLRSSEDLSHFTKIAKLGSGGGRIQTQAS